MIALTLQIDTTIVKPVHPGMIKKIEKQACNTGGLNGIW